MQIPGLLAVDKFMIALSKTKDTGCYFALISDNNIVEEISTQIEYVSYLLHNKTSLKVWIT